RQSLLHVSRLLICRSRISASGGRVSKTCSGMSPQNFIDYRKAETMMASLSTVGVVFGREFRAYFATPLAAIFLVVFLALAGAMTFFISGFFDRNSADLSAFFIWLPWLFLVLLPAIGMRLWAEERRSGTIELLMTLPVHPATFVLGKFLAGWAFTAVALALTFPLWITVNWLGSPDNGVIAAGYIGALMMAGAFLAVASCV